MIRLVAIGVAILSMASPFRLSAQNVQQSPPPNVAARDVFLEQVNQELIRRRDPKLSPELIERERTARTQRETAVRSNPDTFVPLIREALAVAKIQNALVSATSEDRTEDGAEELRRFRASEAVACQFLALLPADRRDRILKESLDAALDAWKPVAGAYHAENAKWKAAGARPEDKSPVAMAQRRSIVFADRCRKLVGAAAAARSDVFIEQVFSWIAKGDRTISLEDQGVGYLEQFPPRREEFIRRLNDIPDMNKDLDRDCKLEIERAIRRLENSGKAPQTPNGKS